MLRWLKKYFIPHSGNDHHPHIFRLPGRLFVLLTLVTLELILVWAVVVSTHSGLLGDIMTSALYGYTNADRAGQNLTQLKISPVLTHAAEDKANDMAAKGYFAHVSPDGKTPWYWFAKAGYNFSYAGENLAVNFLDSKDVTDAWMNSPEHRANILNGHFTEIGIAMARGMYEGRETTFVVQMFGSPAPVAVAYKPPIVVPAPIAQTQFISTDDTPDLALTPAVKSFSAPFKLDNPAAAPRRTVNGLIWVLLLGVGLAFALNILVKAHIQKISPIAHGVLMLGVISMVLYVNHFLVSGMQIF